MVHMYYIVYKMEKNNRANNSNLTTLFFSLFFALSYYFPCSTIYRIDVYIDVLLSLFFFSFLLLVGVFDFGREENFS